MSDRLIVPNGGGGVPSSSSGSRVGGVLCTFPSTPEWKYHWEVGRCTFHPPPAILPQCDIRLEEIEKMGSLVFKGVFHLC